MVSALKSGNANGLDVMDTILLFTILKTRQSRPVFKWLLKIWTEIAQKGILCHVFKWWSIQFIDT